VNSLIEYRLFASSLKASESGDRREIRNLLVKLKEKNLKGRGKKFTLKDSLWDEEKCGFFYLIIILEKNFSII